MGNKVRLLILNWAHFYHVVQPRYTNIQCRIDHLLTYIIIIILVWDYLMAENMKSLTRSHNLMKGNVKSCLLLWVVYGVTWLYRSLFRQNQPHQSNKDSFSITAPAEACRGFCGCNNVLHQSYALEHWIYDGNTLKD